MMKRKESWLVGLAALAGFGMIGAADHRAREVEAEPAYQRALTVAREGDAPRTLDAVEAALREGACPTRVLTEAAFANLHVEARFHELIRAHAGQSSTVLVTPGEPRSRIFGYLRTDDAGHFEFRTIRPGGYQNAVELDGQKRLIPEHIHFEVSAEGYKSIQFQMVFEDDPRMDDHWRTVWAPSMKAAVVAVSRDATGMQTIRHEITLERS